MTEMTTELGKRWLTAKDFPLGRDPDGWPLCRICQARVSTKRNTTCSKACRQWITFACSVQAQARKVCERDKGICALCGCDAEKTQRVFRSTRLRLDYRQLGDVQASMGFNRGSTSATWQMDHIIPVSEGGGLMPGMTVDEAMANLRTLCLPCHKAETRELSKRRRAK